MLHKDVKKALPIDIHDDDSIALYRYRIYTEEKGYIPKDKSILTIFSTLLLSICLPLDIHI